MEKIQIKDLTTDYVIAVLKEAHPLFKDDLLSLHLTRSKSAFGESVPDSGKYANDNGRSKDLTLNYLRHNSRNELFDIILENNTVDYDNYGGEFLSRTRDLWMRYDRNDNSKISQATDILDIDELKYVLLNWKNTFRIAYSFTDSPIENCIRLQAVISAPYLVDDVDVVLGKYFPNLDLVVELLRESYAETKIDNIRNVANFIEANKDEFRENTLAYLKAIDYQTLDGTRIDICDIEIDPSLVNLDVSVSKNNNLTHEEYEDPIMSEFVLIRLQQVQRSLENLLNHKLVSKYTPYADRVGVEVTPDLIFSYASYSYFAQASELKYDYTSQKLLTYLNARLRASKAKTREREILKTFKEQMSPIVERIKEIYTDVRPYVQPRSRYCISEELQSEIMKDFDTGRHDHTQAVIDKLANAISETRALCEAYNDEYRRMLDAIAEDL
jgi:hypothetical protein